MTTTQLIKKIQNHKVDFALYVASGLLAFTTDFTILQVTDSATGNLLLATAAGILGGFIVSYSLNHIRFTKRHAQSRAPKESLPLFAALFVFNTVFTFACLSYNDNNLQLPRVVVKAATVGCIMVWNYLLFHYVVFRKVNKTI